MFTIRRDHTCTRFVTVNVPVEKAFRKETFTAEFKVLDQDEARTIEETAPDGEESRSLLRKVFIGMSDVKDADGNAAEFSDEIRETMIKVPYVAMALIEEYYKAITGLTKRKN